MAADSVLDVFFVCVMLYLIGSFVTRRPQERRRLWLGCVEGRCVPGGRQGASSAAPGGARVREGVFRYPPRPR